MGEEKFEKELKKINNKYKDKPLHHYQDQPVYKKWQGVLCGVVETLKIIGCVCAIGAFVAFVTLIFLVVRNVEKGCL